MLRLRLRLLPQLPMVRVRRALAEGGQGGHPMEAAVEGQTHCLQQGVLVLTVLALPCPVAVAEGSSWARRLQAAHLQQQKEGEARRDGDRPVEAEVRKLQLVLLLLTAAVRLRAWEGEGQGDHLEGEEQEAEQRHQGEQQALKSQRPLLQAQAELHLRRRPTWAAGDPSLAVAPSWQAQRRRLPLLRLTSWL